MRRSKRIALLLLIGLGLMAAVAARPTSATSRPRSAPRQATPVGGFPKQLDRVAQYGGTADLIRLYGQKAFFATGQEVLVFDLALPNSLRLVGRGPALPTLVHGMEVDGEKLYVAHAGGLVIWNIHDPAKPALLGSLDRPNLVNALAVRGNTVFLAEAIDDFGTLTVIDVTDPSSPRFTSSLDLDNPGTAVLADGQNVYVAETRDGGAMLRVVDASNLSDPMLIASLSLPSQEASLRKIGSQLFVEAAELGLIVVDISKPDSPRLVADHSHLCASAVADGPGNKLYVLDRCARALRVMSMAGEEPMDLGRVGLPFAHGGDIALLGNYVAIADGTEGSLLIVDATSPTAPTALVQYPLSGAAQGVTLAGRTMATNVGPTGIGVVDLGPAPPSFGVYVGITVPVQSMVATSGWIYASHRESSQQGVFRVIDARNPIQPAIVAIGRFKPGDLAASQERLYLAAGDLEIFDLTDPALPVRTAIVNVAAKLVAASGFNIAVAARNNHLWVVDTTNSGRPRPLGDIPLSLGESAEITAIAVSDKLALITSEAPLGDGPHLHVVDISDLDAPVYEGSTSEGVGDAPRGVGVDGTTGFVSGSGGLSAYDLTDPSHPKWIAHRDPPAPATDLVMRGHDVYLADQAGGVLVYRLNVAAPTPTPGPATQTPTGPLTRTPTRPGPTPVDTPPGPTPSGPTPILPTPTTGGSPAHEPIFLPMLVKNASPDKSSAILSDGSRFDFLSQFGSPILAIALDGETAFVAAGAQLAAVNLGQTPPKLLGKTPPLLGRILNVAAAGGYAYLALGEGGVAVVDVKDKAHMTVVGQMALPEPAFDVAIKGVTLFVANGANGLVMLNVATPTQPRQVGRHVIAGTSHHVAVDASGFAYVARNADVPGVVAVDARNPAQPQQVGSFPGGFEAEIGGSGFTGGSGLAVASGRLLMPDEFGLGMNVVDIQDPLHPHYSDHVDVVNLPAACPSFRRLWLFGAAGDLGLAISDEGLFRFKLSAPGDSSQYGCMALPTGTPINVGVRGDEIFLVGVPEQATLADLAASAHGRIWRVKADKPGVLQSQTLFEEQATTFEVTGPNAGVGYGMIDTGDRAGVVAVDLADPLMPRTLDLVTGVDHPVLLRAQANRAVLISKPSTAPDATPLRLFVLDLVDPRLPKVRGDVNLDPAARLVKLVVDGDRAYVSYVKAPTTRMVDVYDLANADQPKKVGSAPVDGDVMAAFAGILYTQPLNGPIPGAAFSIFDARNPANIQRLEQIMTGEAIDSFAHDGRHAWSRVHSVQGGPGGRFDLLTWDLADPKHPKPLGRQSLAHGQLDVVYQAGALYLLATGSATSPMLQRYDLTDPSAPKLSAALVVPKHLMTEGAGESARAIHVAATSGNVFVSAAAGGPDLSGVLVLKWVPK